MVFSPAHFIGWPAISFPSALYTPVAVAALLQLPRLSSLQLQQCFWVLHADVFDLEEPPPPEVPTEKIARDPQQAYLAMCLGVKDQNEDLREWIEYHRSIGVGKFYVFDDNSTVPAATALPDLIQEGKPCRTGLV